MAVPLIQQSFVISLISQYDSFLGQLIGVLFLMRPEVLNASEKNISFSQLQNFNSIEDARDFVMNKEIDNIMRKSHTEQIEWIEKHFNIRLIQELSSWPRFIEATERRNLFVHTGGVVSSQYVDICRKYDVSFVKNIEIGQELEVSSDYFHQIHECVLDIGIKIAHLLWRKVQPKSLEEADDNLVKLSYKFLLEERFKLASNILDFAVEGIKKHSRESVKRTLIVNRAQAYKWNEDEKKAKEIMAGVDWSASKDSFRLAEAVIMDDFDEAKRLVRKIGDRGEVRISDFREWPLFRKLRKDEEFLKIFEEVFNEALYIYNEKDLFVTIDWIKDIGTQKVSEEDIS